MFNIKNGKSVHVRVQFTSLVNVIQRHLDSHLVGWPRLCCSTRRDLSCKGEMYSMRYYTSSGCTKNVTYS